MKTIFWKAYSALLATLTVLSIFLSISTPGILWIEYAPRIIFMTFAAFGLIGFSWKKHLGRQWIWKIIFFLVSISFVLVILTSGNSEANWDFCKSLWCYTLYNAIGFIIVAPILIGLFQYAFKCKEIWEKK